MMFPSIVLFLAAAELIPAGGQPAPLSSSVLKQRLAKTQDRLWAWEIEYESAREDRSGVSAKSYVHRVVAVKVPDRFFHWGSHGAPWVDWREDPYQQRLTVTSDRMVVEYPWARIFTEKQLAPKDPLPGTAPQELLLMALGWWPLAQRPSPNVNDDLPAALSAVANSPKYKARAQLKQVGGRWCHVLECPGRDALWLDVERGCAVVARQLSYPQLAKVHRVEFANFREVLPGIWAPFRLRNIHYERASDGSLGKIILDAPLTILRVRLNEQVDDSRFRFKPQPGSAGKIGDQPLRQVKPGGEEYLDEVVEWIRLIRPQTGDPTVQTSWVNWPDVAFGALFGGGMVTALIWWQRRISRRGGES